MVQTHDEARKFVICFQTSHEGYNDVHFKIYLTPAGALCGRTETWDSESAPTLQLCRCGVIAPSRNHRGTESTVPHFDIAPGSRTAQT